MNRPLIGVTGSDRGLPLAWWFIRWALSRAGAKAVYLTHTSPGRLEALDGIVISGGDDIDRGLYLAEHDAPGPADPERDRFEIRVLEHLMGSRLPVLGICRGAQLMNVVRGGTLYPDLRDLRRKTSNRRTPLARKTLLVAPDSGLEGILGESRLRINSLHQQAIKDLGEGLVVSGRDLDGFVQAVEHPGEPFLYGVQWHPEYLPLRAPQRALFSSLVRAAAGDEPRARQ